MMDRSMAGSKGFYTIEGVHYPFYSKQHYHQWLLGELPHFKKITISDSVISVSLEEKYNSSKL
jgi:hypothetical protein